jgi:PPM family protein phosphatase
MTISLRYAALSDIGRVRKKNEDSGYASARLLVQADGMGGPPAGDLASATTVQTMRRLDEPVTGDLVEALAGAVHRANDRLSEMVEADPSIDGMGCTLDALLTDGERVALAHIGDSRAYLLRGGALTQLTNDHTFVQTLVDEGRITLEEARTHPHRSLMIRALDGRSELEPDIALINVQPGDRIMLCSDGLSGFVNDAAIARLMAIGTVDAAADALVRTALDSGSNDNVTCIIGEVTDENTTFNEPLVVGAAAEQAARSSDTSRQAPIVDQPDDTDDRDPEELRYAPLAPRRFRWLRRIVILIVLLAVIALTGKWLYDWSQRQYYVAEHNGHVTIFRGLDGNIGSFNLSSVYHEYDELEVAALPEYQRSEVEDGIEVNDLAEARSAVAALQEDATPEPTEPSGSQSSPTSPSSPTKSPTKSPDKSPRNGGGGRS